MSKEFSEQEIQETVDVSVALQNGECRLEVVEPKKATYLTQQEIFDKVAIHLLAQNCKSMIGAYMCAYRGDAGMKCAAGVLVRDEFYDARLEGMSVSYSLDVQQALINSGVSPQDLPLVERLQAIHDKSFPSHWREDLLELAREQRLSSAVLE